MPKTATQETIHPGEILKSELEELGLKQKDFAEEIGIAYTQLNEIINGHRSITADFAVILEAALGIEGIFWLNCQSLYDFAISKKKMEKKQITQHLEEWNKIRQYIPYSYFKKQNVLTGDVAKDEAIIKNIYKVDTLNLVIDKVSCSGHQERYRLTQSRKSNPINMAGWLNLVAYKAELSKDVSEFKESCKQELIDKLRKVLQGKKIIQNCEKTLNNYGVKIVIQEKPEEAPIDGVAFWSQNNPVIGLTRRYNRLDNFAFTLFHELGHVFLHSSKLKNKELSIDLLDNLDDIHISKEKEEIEANEFAANNLIPTKSWNEFVEKYFEFSDKSIKDFAKEIGIPAAVVVGRLRFENPILYKRRFKINNDIL
jgi:HTH-type transcriptional regulator / antitoxin HigA